MNYIVSHVPQDGLNKLEEISFLTKNKDVIKTDDFLKSEESRCYAKPADKETKDATAYGIEESSDFFKVSSILISFINHNLYLDSNDKR